MPIVEVVYVSERELAPERLDAFARRARRAFADVVGSRPEQVRVVAQRCAGAAGEPGAERGSGA